MGLLSEAMVIRTDTKNIRMKACLFTKGFVSFEYCDLDLKYLIRNPGLAGSESHMENLVNLLFEARMLKKIPRSGFHFLGAGKESVAEHVYMMTFVAFVMAKSHPDVDLGVLLSMCLLHDLPEARIGDLNAVWKKYVQDREEKAIADLAATLPFGKEMTDLLETFNRGETEEAKLARDADQIAFILELKALADIGYKTPGKWIDHVAGRLKTETGKSLAHGILEGEWDDWWLKRHRPIPI